MVNGLDFQSDNNIICSVSVILNISVLSEFSCRKLLLIIFFFVVVEALFLRFDIESFQTPCLWIVTMRKEGCYTDNIKLVLEWTPVAQHDMQMI